MWACGAVSRERRAVVSLGVEMAERGRGYVLLLPKPTKREMVGRKVRFRIDI